MSTRSWWRGLVLGCVGLLAACGGGGDDAQTIPDAAPDAVPDAAPTACPDPTNGSSGDVVEGMACDTTETCFVVNTFSSCASGYYECIDHHFHEVRGLGAADGASCADAAITTCAYEGNLNCSAEPTAQHCSCGADGTWSCICACYSPTGSCGACPADYSPGLTGLACDPAGGHCDFGDHSCDCLDDGTGTSTFHCQ